MPSPIIVFDLDDTLYSERQFAISGFRACERWLEARVGAAARGTARAMTELLDTGHMRAIFEITLAKHIPDHTAGDLDSYIGAYKDHLPEIELYPDAAWALRHFSEQGPLGLITDGPHEVQASKVKALAIAQHFHSIVYTSALGGRSFSKPHPLSYETVEAALGTAGRPLVYVGDNPAKDFITPNRRGWISVQVVKPFRIHARAVAAEGGHPHHRIEALTELPGLLASL